MGGSCGGGGDGSGYRRAREGVPTKRVEGSDVRSIVYMYLNAFQAHVVNCTDIRWVLVLVAEKISATRRIRTILRARSVVRTTVEPACCWLACWTKCPYRVRRCENEPSLPITSIHVPALGMPEQTLSKN